MAPSQVRDALRAVMAASLNVAGQGNNLISIPTVGNTGVRVYDVGVVQTVPAGFTGNAPLTLINGEWGTGSNLPGSDFGVYAAARPASDNVTALLRAGRKTVNINTTQGGVHIDDVIVGLAERGETFSGPSLGSTWVDNPFARPSFDGAPLSVVNDGNYQLEIRTSRELLMETGNYKWVPAFVDMNERLAQGVNLTVIHGGASIADGDSFTIARGVETLRFEFDDRSITSDGISNPNNIAIPYTSSFTAGQVADAIRAAINSAGVQSKLGVTATSRGAATVDPTDPVIVFSGSIAADLLGGVNFGTHLTATLTGRDDVYGEDLSDVNRVSDQGQIIVQGTIVRDSLQFGLVADAAARVNGLPTPGAVRNLPTLNADQEVHGVVFMNNLLIDNQAGVSVSGVTEMLHRLTCSHA